MLKWQQKLAIIVTSLAITFSVGHLVTAAPDSGASAKTSFGDFGFRIPSNWSRVTPDMKKTKAMLVLNPRAGGDPDGMIMIDVGKPAFPTAKELAKKLAGQDGKVYPDPVPIDGSEGIKVETTSTDMSRPRFGIVVFRDEKVYLIMAAQKPGTDVSGAVDGIVKSWTWEKGH